MEIKIHESQPLMTDQRIMPELTNRQSRTIKPVSKGKGNTTRKVGDDQEKRGKERDSSNQKKRDEGESLEEFDGREGRLFPGSCLGITQNGEAGEELIVTPAGEITRQVPVADLLQVHTGPKQVRGRIFDTKI